MSDLLISCHIGLIGTWNTINCSECATYLSSYSSASNIKNGPMLLLDNCHLTPPPPSPYAIVVYSYNQRNPYVALLPHNESQYVNHITDIHWQIYNTGANDPVRHICWMVCSLTVTYDWFPVIWWKSWRVPQLGQAMLTLSGTSDFTPFR